MCEGKCVVCDPIEEWDEDHYDMAETLREFKLKNEKPRQTSTTM